MERAACEQWVHAAGGPMWAAASADSHSGGPTLEQAITDIVRAWHPDVLGEFGVGPLVATVLLCAWSHPGRVRPRPPSPTSPVLHRLNRCDDRQLNRALQVVCCADCATTPRPAPRARAYAERRRAEGKTDREIKRCLKRDVARQLFRLLTEGAGSTPRHP